MFIKNFFGRKRRKELRDAYQKIIENAYKKHIPEKHIIFKYANLHVLSKSEADVDIEKIFKIIKRGVDTKGGTLDFTTKSRANDIIFKLESNVYVKSKDDRTLVFNKGKVENEDQESNKLKNTLNNFAASKLITPIKDKEYTPSNLFIYIVEKRKIYDGNEFISEYLQNDKEITLFYKGSINYVGNCLDEFHKTKAKLLNFK